MMCHDVRLYRDIRSECIIFWDIICLSMCLSVYLRI